MPDQHLKIDDFLTYEGQLTRRLGRMDDNLEALRGQVNALTGAFKSYIAETDLYRIETNKRLAGIDTRLSNLEQMVSQGFALIFARLGITPP